jgi:hypothetical protein
MTILHGDDRVYNNIFIQNAPVKETEAKEDMGFIMEDNQVVGTSVFDEYPTYDEWVKPFDLDGMPNMFTMQEYHFKKLPVWIDGNAYLNGAVAWKNEQNKLVNDTEKAYVELVEQDGKYSIKTNIYDIIGSFADGIINSDILGEAFEPEQRFENPDGTAIIFDKDYLGEHRGLSTIPGPFASAEAAKKQLW